MTKRLKLQLSANAEDGDMITKFYKLFDANNGLLKHAKTYNSTFGFISTLLLVPGLIIWLTNVCERMTKRRTDKDFALAQAQNSEKTNAAEKDVKTQSDLTRFKTDNLSMAGFMKK